MITLTTFFFESASKNRSNVFSQTVTVELADCGDEESEVVEDGDMTDEDRLLVLPATGVSPIDGGIESISEVRIDDLIRGSSYDAVYYIEQDGTRRPFLNETIYFTHFADFDDVVEVSDATLGVIPMGPPMLPKAGTVLIKFVSDDHVYALELHATDHSRLVRRHVASEQVAAALYGAGWADYVIDLDVLLYGRFVAGEEMSVDSEVEVGTIQRRAD